MTIDDPHQSIFRTRWSLIHEACASDPNTEKSKRAVEEIIRRYQPAIFSAIRRHGLSPVDSEDLCQEFLVHSFLGKILPRADRSRGRFRTFLLHSLRLYLISHHRALAAEKRGYGRVSSIQDLEYGENSSALAFEEPRAELEFEMDFAQCIHERVLAGLEKEYASRNQERTFTILVPYILEKEARLDQQVADALEITEATARQALSRLRQRYGAAIQAEVLEILDPGDDFKGEVKDILKLILAKSRNSRSSENKGMEPGEVNCR